MNELLRTRLEKHSKHLNDEYYEKLFAILNNRQKNEELWKHRSVYKVCWQ